MNAISPTKSLKGNHAAYFPWLERILLCLAVLLAYANVWSNEFVFDDRVLIEFNNFLKYWNNLPKLLTSLNYAGYAQSGADRGFYHPIQMLLYFFIYQAFGLSTVAFHALNVALQALNACLLHHFGIRAGFNKGAAFTAALLWAVHPLHTSDVTYMASTAELLWSFFCLLGLITLLPDFTSRKIWQAIIFFLLALGSKESAVVFPALAATTFFFVSKDRVQVAAYLKMWPLWLLAAGYIVLWLIFMHETGFSLANNGDPVIFQDYISNSTNRALTCLSTLPVYARLIIWPAGLHIERLTPLFTTIFAWQPAAGVLMVGLGLLQILWGQARRGLALSFGLLWFAVALSPATGIVVPVDALIHEGWMYMPTMGLFLGVAQTAAGFFKKRQNTARVLVLALAFSLGITTFFQNVVWRNIETLYQNVLQNKGHVDRLSIRLTMFYLERQEFDKAAELSRYELDHLDALPKGMWAEAHFEAAMIWLQVRLDENDLVSLDAVINALPSCRHIPEVIGELGKTLIEDPDFLGAHIFLAAIYHYQGNEQMADFHQRAAESIKKKQGE